MEAGEEMRREEMVEGETSNITDGWRRLISWSQLIVHEYMCPNYIPANFGKDLPNTIGIQDPWHLSGAVHSGQYSNEP